MFSTAELGQKIAKSEFKEKAPVLRRELLDTQQRLLKHRKCPVIIVFAGVNGAGKGETVNLLNAWMDPRWLITRAFSLFPVFSFVFYSSIYLFLFTPFTLH